MADGAWQTQRERRQTRDDIREAKRRLVIEWQDKFWLASNHPVDDSVLAWLAENRPEASKIGSSRWHLETLPDLTERQRQLRQAEAFAAVLERAATSRQTVTVQDVLSQAGAFPQPDPVENKKRRARRKDAGFARKPQVHRRG